jgi:CoA:oxalate CoA-transferase
MTISTRKKPLAGIRVIDFTTMIAGPYCTRLLADCGAEVIKVEAETGDFIRQIAPFSGEQSTYFAHLNGGKKSVVLDLKKEADRQKATRLIKSADVVVENNRPGVMKRLGLDYGRFAEDCPELVYCAISGFGQTGPRSQEPAYAPIVHAMSGFDLAQMSYQDELSRPEKCGIFTADVMAAVYAFGAIQTALFSRERHGGGQFIDVALLETMISMLIYECQTAQSPIDQLRTLYTPTATTDGFIIVAPVNQKNFEDMANAMGHPEWISDSRFEQVSERRRNWEDVTVVIESWTSQRSSRECEKILSTGGVPCSRYQTVAEAIVDPQISAREFMVDVRNDAGGFRIPNPPFKFNDNSVGVVPSVPELGEHNDHYLTE